MKTKEEIQAIMEEILETFPKLKEKMIEEEVFDIRQEKDGWICFIKTKYSQFGEQPGQITTTFDLDGKSIRLSIFDFGRAWVSYLEKDVNGKYIGVDKPI